MGAVGFMVIVAEGQRKCTTVALNRIGREEKGIRL
jgi:hypothetical protein